jgi:GTPase SAR1 family protein
MILEVEMIARLKPEDVGFIPVTEIWELRTESDVEQKLLYPFLCHPSYLGIPSDWVRTKGYMEPTEIDKGAGKRIGFVPDYSIWRGGFPLAIIEAKSPDETIETALREAHLYAGRINNRYPPNVSPIGYVLACNGEQFALAAADSEAEVLYAKCTDVQPGSAILAAIRNVFSAEEFEKRAQGLSTQFQSRRFHKVSSILSAEQVNEQLGINPFAQELFPIITRYFGAETDEATDEIIDRGYVSSAERTEYGSVLETYLKDRARVASAGLLRPIVTSINTASELSGELQKFWQNPKFFGRVQLIVGAVGAGKSIFIRRFYRRLMPKEVRDRTLWAFINFNVEFSDIARLRETISDRFIKSFTKLNNVNVEDLEHVEKLFRPELAQFERGPAKLLLKTNEQQYNHQRYLKLKELTADQPRLVEAIARHYTGEKRLGIVCVFDNVDKRSRDLQLAIFEAAQWFKDITRALVIVNLRDSTFEAHRDEPPLDAFINAVNFYIRPPRFAEVIRKRLEIVLENIESDNGLARFQNYALESGAKVTYSSTRLGEFLMSIYLSLFEKRGSNIGAALESLVARNVRRALGMFADIIASPHIPTSQITTAAVSGPGRIDEDRIVRALMRGRYRIFNNRGQYVRNILSADMQCKRPSNFLYADILEFLIRNRKQKIDFSVEGYASGRTIVHRMGQLGYDEDDAFRALTQLVTWNLVEPESLLVEQLTVADPVQVHAAGFIHMRYFLKRIEYLFAVSADLNLATYELAEESADVWRRGRQAEPGYRAKQRIINRLADYFKGEYERRCRRHAFYEDLGYGGKLIVQSTRFVADHVGKPSPTPPSRKGREHQHLVR